jgi:DeoR/GlpR family transcriptional regulator of sugar metabolism
MTIDERKSEILRVLNEDSTVRSGELSARFGVSEDTIRRDLRSLADAGLIRRVYGGAVAPAQTSQIFADRLQESVAAKSAIVRAAATLSRPGQTISLDSGTTVAGLAACLPSDLPLTVITHSLPAAMALVEKPLIEVVVLGGKLLAKSAAMVGPEVVAGYTRCRADLCFLGVTSVDPETGITVYDYDNAEVKRAMIASAQKVAVLAAADKLGTSAPFVVGPTTAIDWLVTDAGRDSLHVEELEARGVEVITV